MGMEEGEVAGHNCDNSSFTSMLLCSFVFLCFFFLCLLVNSFSFSSLFKGIPLILMEYWITMPEYLCLHLFVQRTSIVQSFFFLPVKRNLKASALGLFCCYITH